MAVSAVIFDWGGTLTPWHTVDHSGLWLGVCTRHYPAAQATALAAAASDVPTFEASVPDAVITRLADLLGHLDRW